MALPAKTWAKIKTEYETGNYSTVQLAKKWQISDQAVRKHIRDEKWKKGQLKPIIESKIQKTMVEKFAEIGLTPEKVMRVVDEGVHADKTIIVGSGDQAMADIIPDWQARDRFVTQYYKLTGGYAAEKVEHSGDIEVTDPRLKNYSDEEIQTLINILTKKKDESE